MGSTLCFYLDDSGARDPDRAFDESSKNQDWFALGGLIISEDDRDQANILIQEFKSRWPEIGVSPLHSYEIRNRLNRYRWLAAASAESKTRFMNELSDLIGSLPVLALACVIDRPRYNARYRQKYGPRRWLLCRTAFSIAVERAVKYARYRSARLRVFPERSDKKTEAQFKFYYDELRERGTPFDADNAKKYAPVTPDQFEETLLEFRVKGKESELMQVADLMLWPVAKGGYEPEHRPYVYLREKGKLLDQLCTSENGLLGSKYSCFDDPEPPPEKQKPALAGS